MSAREWVAIGLLALSTAAAASALFARRPRRIVLGWLAVGVSQSAFLLVIGFELLAFLNFVFAVGGATVLQVYSALFGTGASFEAERIRDRRGWVYGIGAGATLSAILVFGFSEIDPGGTLSADLDAARFSGEILNRFPELSIVLGMLFFLGIVVWASIGRPGWKRTEEGKR